MIRRWDWQSRLVGALGRKMGARFAWGENDCCLFAADLILEMTGADLVAPHRGKYRTARGAKGRMRRGGGLASMADRLLPNAGCPEVPVSRAQRGDVVLLETDDGPAVGICLGEVSAFVAIGRDGYATVPTLSCVRAWRVG